MDLTAILETTSVVVAIVIGGSGLTATMWAIGKVKGIETTVTLLNGANEGLRNALSDERDKRQTMEYELREQLALQERQCATEIAQLRGQVDALTGDLANRIVGLVASVLEDIRAKEK
ncbi:MAG: hypothetical protein EBR82_33990 [Caulobacteraceae bacterium]|nr:hypothetical protein [Caulobacteraceae bacterium]